MTGPVAEHIVTPDDIGDLVGAERRRLCTLLDTLGDADWDAASLCTGWAVRDVVAHLTTTTRTTPLAMFGAMIGARGDFHRMTFRRARRAARSSPKALTAHLREDADARRRMPGSAPLDPLVDILVHGQDIARPLGRELAPPAQTVAVALEFAATNLFYDAPARFAGLRLVATDSDWDCGSGTDTVSGTSLALLLVATARSIGLTELRGPGLAQLQARMLPARDRDQRF